MTRHRLLFVCLGNICRSPLAQGVFVRAAEQAGRGGDFIAESAGTAAWHAGKPPDPRAVAAAMRRGIDISSQRARQVRQDDFENFGIILAMDASNLAALLEIAPPEYAAEVRLFLDGGPGDAPREVPDPYYGGDDGFDRVLDLCERGARSLIAGL